MKRKLAKTVWESFLCILPSQTGSTPPPSANILSWTWKKEEERKMDEEEEVPSKARTLHLVKWILQNFSCFPFHDHWVKDIQKHREITMTEVVDRCPCDSCCWSSFIWCMTCCCCQRRNHGHPHLLSFNCEWWWWWQRERKRICRVCRLLFLHVSFSSSCPLVPPPMTSWVCAGEKRDFSPDSGHKPLILFLLLMVLVIMMVTCVRERESERVREREMSLFLLLQVYCHAAGFVRSEERERMRMRGREIMLVLFLLLFVLASLVLSCLYWWCRSRVRCQIWARK